MQSRLLVVYRLDAGLVSELLPPGLAPRLVQSYAVGAVCYTRLGRTPFFARRTSGSDHLAYRFAVRREDGVEGTWIARRETSSWLEARCGSKLLRGEYGRSVFRVQSDAFGIELAVEGERGEEFYLRGEAAGASANALFTTPHALEGFLGCDRLLKPYDVFAPEADELDLAAHCAPEPLAVFEARSAFFSEAPFTPGASVLDSAWRIVTRRLVGAPARRPNFRVLAEPGTSAPAFPTS